VNRLISLIIVALALTGCESRHNMTWPGVHIDGRGGTFHRVSWSAEDYKGTPAPGFSFRTPDGADALTTQTGG
jgi:hypothetical protein